MSKRMIPREWIGAAIVLMVVTGLIHLFLAPQHFQEVPYVGVLFAANGLGALIAAMGIYHGSRTWGWELGALMAAGAMFMYILARTAGLPGMEVETNWLEPIGLLSIIVEGAFVVIAWPTLTRYSIESAGERLTWMRKSAGLMDNRAYSDTYSQHRHT